jgi:hypothetical protein
LLVLSQICHPDRSAPGFPATRHSPTSTCAAFVKESRRKFANATKFNRKSGEAQRRDLQCALPSNNSCLNHRPQICHPDRSEPGFPATQPSPTSTCAAFVKESRRKFANATKFNRKSGEAQRRDLRCALPSNDSCLNHRPQICHPDRSEPGFPATQHSPTSTCAAFVKESRMKFANATKFNRKSGEAQRRDLRCALPSNDSCLNHRPQICH